MNGTTVFSFIQQQAVVGSQTRSQLPVFNFCHAGGLNHSFGQSCSQHGPEGASLHHDQYVSIQVYPLFIFGNLSHFVQQSQSLIHHVS